jgi:hypothetical protein
VRRAPKRTPALPRRPSGWPGMTTELVRQEPHVDHISCSASAAALVTAVPPRSTMATLGNSSLLIRRLCHAHQLPAHSGADLPKCCSLVRGIWQR